MKPENWTDCEHPCFEDYFADSMSMTKDEFIEQDENLEDCDCFTADDCRWKQGGHDWHDCLQGRLSSHCDWLPKEAKK